MKTQASLDLLYETGSSSRKPTRSSTPIPARLIEWEGKNSELVSSIKRDDFRDSEIISYESLAQHPIIARALESETSTSKKEKGPHIIEQTDWVSVHARTQTAKNLILSVANGRSKVSGREILANSKVQKVLTQAQTRYESHRNNVWYKATNPASIARLLIHIKTPMDVNQLIGISQEYLAENAPKKLSLKK